MQCICILQLESNSLIFVHLSRSFIICYESALENVEYMSDSFKIESDSIYSNEVIGTSFTKI